MTFEALRTAVLEANKATVRHDLVKATFGNVSGIDRENGRIAIKASGVPYDSMTTDHMVLTDLEGTPLNTAARSDVHLQQIEEKQPQPKLRSSSKQDIFAKCNIHNG